jgi:hypothetical protein
MEEFRRTTCIRGIEAMCVCKFLQCHSAQSEEEGNNATAVKVRQALLITQFWNSSQLFFSEPDTLLEVSEK